MINKTSQTRNEMAKIAGDLVNLPTGEEPVGTIYIPQTKRSFDEFEYYKYNDGFNFVAKATRKEVGYLADAVSEIVGKRYSVITTQAAYDKIFFNPNYVLKDPTLKEIARYCYVHTREVIHGRKIFSDPVIRFVAGKYKVSGKSLNVEEYDLYDPIKVLEKANLFKESDDIKDCRETFGGRILTNPGSYSASWLIYDTLGGRICEAFRVEADTLADWACNFIAVLMRTDENQERVATKIGKDKKEPKDGRTGIRRYSYKTLFPK